MGGKKMENPHSLKSNEMAQVTFRPQQPLVVDSFKNCEGLSRIAFLDGNTAVMLGKVVSVTAKSDMPAEDAGKKKKAAFSACRDIFEGWGQSCAAPGVPLFPREPDTRWRCCARPPVRCPLSRCVLVVVSFGC